MKEIVVITGVTGKLGQNLVDGLQNKYKIVALFRYLDKAISLFQKYDIDFIQCDLSNHDDIIKSCHYINKKYKTIKGLINNAALDINQAMEKTTFEELEMIFKVNTFAPYYLCKYLIESLSKAKGASIINVSSNLACRSIYNATEYSMTKASVESLSKSISVEYGKYGIRCNTLVIGGMPGIMTCVGEEKFFSKKEDDFDDCKVSIEKIPLGRQGNFNEFINVFDFLLSNLSSYMTGSKVSVDGGIFIKG